MTRLFFIAALGAFAALSPHAAWSDYDEADGAIRAPEPRSKLDPGMEEPAAGASEIPTPPPGFEPVSGKAHDRERVEASPLVVAAYMAVWVLLVGYILLIWRRQSRINEELVSLAERIESREEES